MTAQDKPIVFDAMMGTDRKTVWVERSRFYCRCGAGRIECQMEQPGIYRTIPGTFESAPKPKQLSDWRRRALARMQS